VHHPDQSTLAIRIELVHTPGVVLLTAAPEATKPLSAVVSRLRAKLQKIYKKLKTPAPSLQIQGRDGAALDLSLPVGDLREGTVRIGENTTIPIRYNPPAVIRVEIPGYPMVGCPIVPVVRVEHSDATSFCWMRAHPRREAPDDEWEHVGRSFCYTPSEEDHGGVLMVEVVPHRTGQPDGRSACCVAGTTFARDGSTSARSVANAAIVSLLPRTGYFYHRHAHTRTSAGSKGIRVVSYNLLADYNLRNVLGRGDDVFWGVFKDRATEMAMEYRRQVLLREMVGYNADLFLLQEVDKECMFEQFLAPQMEQLGYEGVYANKVHTSSPLGQAVFWKESRYELVRSLEVDLTRAPILDDDSHARSRQLHKLITRNDVLRSVLSRTTTVANVVLLRPRGSGGGPWLCVVNNHFFGDPGAPHVRMVQGALVLAICEEFITAAWQDHGLGDVALVVGGDFNCGSGEGLCEFLANGEVSETHPDWDASETFRWRTFNTDQPVGLCGGAEGGGRAAMQLSHSFSLANGGPSLMEHTWLGHVGEYGPESLVCVDHVFYDTSRLSLSGVVPVAPREFVEEHGAPSSAFASDHAAVILDFNFTLGE